jgi:hypothetical protein
MNDIQEMTRRYEGPVEAHTARAEAPKIQGSAKYLQYSGSAALSDGRLAVFQGHDQVFGVQLQLFQANFFKLFILAEIRFLEQFLQPLGVATMFGVETINLFAQRTVLYFIHQAPPFMKEHLHISPLHGNSQAGKRAKAPRTCGFRRITQSA